ncbi:hypothetical protein [Serratia rubidaea]|nr:hypothetical protein [Serratia rubidaea]MCR0996779.1 hypothetical protein [Serratia rubidaea]
MAKDEEYKERISHYSQRGRYSAQEIIKLANCGRTTILSVKKAAISYHLT